MTDKNPQIHEFSPTIYPFKLWVSVNPSFEDVKDKFWLLHNDNERIDFDAEKSWNSTTTVASCYPVSDKGSVQKRQIVCWCCSTRSEGLSC